MAESREGEQNCPPRGKVQEVCKQWSVHEDGALAYQIQNEEITQHYGLNRFNRRTVRDDIPIAKIVQSEEEIRLQEERLRQLETLKAQAEEDAKVAEKISEQMKEEVAGFEECRALDDEELARQLQEREKKKYERHLEKKREKKLKKERDILENSLARDSEEARRVYSQGDVSENVVADLEAINLQGANSARSASRVTSSGHIEEGGDFSDFYKLPDEIDEFTRMEIQASQDEELARLLQEQEHKRTKAEIDQEKLRQIELQDEQLARVIQEQEQLRSRKTKQKQQTKESKQRQVSTESMPLGASANSMKQQSPSTAVSAAMPINSSGHNRYRSNSYTQAFDSPPSPACSQAPHRQMSERSEQSHKPPKGPSDEAAVSSSYASTHHQYSKAQHMMSPPLSSSVSSPRSAYIGPGGGLSTLESARRIAAGDHERIMEIQNLHNTVVNFRGTSLQERANNPRDTSNTMDIIRAHSHHGNTPRSASGLPDSRQLGRIPQSDTGMHTHGHAAPSGAELRDADAGEVLRWLTSQEGSKTTNLPAAQKAQLSQPHHSSRSGSGSCYTDEDDDPHHSSYPNGSAGFNIATAIDPTYQRRHPEAHMSEETQLKSLIPFSRSLPQNDGELEWDPGLRGSLRKTKAPIHNYPESTANSSFSHSCSVAIDPVMSAWQPVQGQRRGDQRSRNKSRKQNSSESEGKKDKGNCKQQ